MIRRSATAVVERNVTWEASFATEPWEAAWAGEALFFVRRLSSMADAGDDTTMPTEVVHSPDDTPLLTARVQISPDGMHWVDEGSCLVLRDQDEMAFVRLREFGGWLRLTGEVAPGRRVTVIVYLALKE